MTIPCANCGEPLADDAYRCPSCDALAPLPDDDDGVDRTEALPWAIPIRDAPGHDVRVRAAPRDPLRPVVLGVLIVAVLAGAVVLASGVLGGGDGADDDPARTEVAGETADADVESDSTSSTTADDASTTTSTTTSSTTSTTTTSTTSTTAPPTSTTAAPSPGSVSQLSSSFRGGWVAQLTSVPTSAGSEAVENAWSKARSYASGAVVTHSDDWSSLEPGYWVVVDAGPFESADEARSFCASVAHGEEADCLPRELRGRR